MDVTVVGSFMVDMLVRSPHFPAPGETVVGEEVNEYLGGKGANQAVAAARAGARTAMLGVVGQDDHGERFIDVLEGEGIDCRHVRRDRGLGTGMAFPIVVPGGENSIIVVPRANSTFSDSDVDLAADLIRSSRVLLVQLELPLGPIAHATRTARESGVTVILNAAPGVASLDGFSVDHLVVNLTEAHQLLGASPPEPPDVARRLREHLQVTSVVVTLGAGGSVIADERGVSDIAPFAVTAIDTVGAGDAYCGFLACEVASGRTIREAAALGSIAGALTTTGAGALPSIPTRAQVDSATRALT